MSLDRRCSLLDGSNPLPLMAAALLLVACSRPPTHAYTVGGTVTGLVGTGLVIQNNGGDDLAVTADGAFTFTIPLAKGSGYAVTVETQPVAPDQICVVTNAARTMAVADVTNVAVTCRSLYVIGGTVGGLTGSNLVLQNNMSDDLAVPANGTFTFETPMTSGSSYWISVKKDASPNQLCNVAHGSGTVANADVTNVEVTCLEGYTIDGSRDGRSRRRSVPPPPPEE